MMYRNHTVGLIYCYSYQETGKPKIITWSMYIYISWTGEKQNIVTFTNFIIKKAVASQNKLSDEYNLLGYDTVQSGGHLMPFRRYHLAPSSESKSKPNNQAESNLLFSPEDDHTFLRNVNTSLRLHGVTSQTLVLISHHHRNLKISRNNLRSFFTSGPSFGASDVFFHTYSEFDRV
jgi:hypothetical protein